MKERNDMPYTIVEKFEDEISGYAGAAYGIAVDSCCNALFLCLKYNELFWSLRGNGQKKELSITIPKRTYPGVACSIINAGYKIKFKDKKWKGIYHLAPYRIIDSALRFKMGMYILDSIYCISFHAKKHLPIGRGGMILTDSEFAYRWFKKARFDGRNQCPLNKDKIDSIGWNMYMTPEQAARGLMLFDVIKDKNLLDMDSTKQNYPDLSKVKAYIPYYAKD
jgi:dTDP-4-amino-4,6-dideoxygalactose transaminase